jgi:hypothetical protein
MLVVCFPDKLAPFVLIEGQESCIPTVHGYMIKLQEPDDGVKSIAGSPISVPVACDVSVLGQVLKYFQICFYPLTSVIFLVFSVGAKGVLARLDPVPIFPLS